MSFIFHLSQKQSTAVKVQQVQYQSLCALNIKLKSSSVYQSIAVFVSCSDIYFFFIAQDWYWSKGGTLLATTVSDSRVFIWSTLCSGSSGFRNNAGWNYGKFSHSLYSVLKITITSWRILSPSETSLPFSNSYLSFARVWLFFIVMGCLWLLYMDWKDFLVTPAPLILDREEQNWYKKT